MLGNKKHFKNYHLQAVTDIKMYCFERLPRFCLLLWTEVVALKS